MPWLQGFGGVDTKAVKLLTGSDSPPVPYYILVGADGKVTASTPNLDIEQLPTLLPP